MLTCIKSGNEFLDSCYATAFELCTEYRVPIGLNFDHHELSCLIFTWDHSTSHKANKNTIFLTGIECTESFSVLMFYLKENDGYLFENIAIIVLVYSRPKEMVFPS